MLRGKVKEGVALKDQKTEKRRRETKYEIEKYKYTTYRFRDNYRLQYPSRNLKKNGFLP